MLGGDVYGPFSDNAPMRDEQPLPPCSHTMIGTARSSPPNVPTASDEACTIK